MLIHAGILQAELEVDASVNVAMPDDDCFVFAENDGLIEPLADLGEMVHQGDALARIWPGDRTGVSPVDYVAKRDGLLAGKHFPGLVKTGDSLAVVAEMAD